MKLTVLIAYGFFLLGKIKALYNFYFSTLQVPFCFIPVCKAVMFTVQKVLPWLKITKVWLSILSMTIQIGMIGTFMFQLLGVLASLQTKLPACSSPCSSPSPSGGSYWTSMALGSALFLDPASPHLNLIKQDLQNTSFFICIFNQKHSGCWFMQSFLGIVFLGLSYCCNLRNEMIHKNLYIWCLCWPITHKCVCVCYSLLYSLTFGAAFAVLVCLEK